MSAPELHREPWELFAWTIEGDDAATALARAPLGSVGFGWSRSAVRLFTHAAAAQFIGDDGFDVDLTGWFEARAFGEWGELRWYSSPSGTTSTVYISPTHLIPPPGAKPLTTTSGPALIDSTTVVWGESIGRTLTPGWSTTTEARIGTLRWPIANVAAGSRIALRSREYLRKGEHGNAVIDDELLIRFEVLGTKEKGAK